MSKKFLGKEFDEVRARRIRRLAGEPNIDDVIDDYINDLRQKGKLHPILDIFDSKINRELGKKLYKDEEKKK